jgi:hypothetical protein
MKTLLAHSDIYIVSGVHGCFLTAGLFRPTIHRLQQHQPLAGPNQASQETS